MQGLILYELKNESVHTPYGQIIGFALMGLSILVIPIKTHINDMSQKTAVFKLMMPGTFVRDPFYVGCIEDIFNLNVFVVWQL